MADLQCNSCDGIIRSENLVLDQQIIPYWYFSLSLRLACLLLFKCCREKLCLGHPQELRVQKMYNMHLVGIFKAHLWKSVGEVNLPPPAQALNIHWSRRLYGTVFVIWTQKVTGEGECKGDQFGRVFVNVQQIYGRMNAYPPFLERSSPPPPPVYRLLSDV